MSDEEELLVGYYEDCSEMIPIDSCIHPEIAEWYDPLRQETLIQCQWCRMKVAFPDQMLITAERLPTRHELLFIAFGADVADRFAPR